jgi:hypothetical protein
MAAWNARRLDDLDVVYSWVDGVYAKAGLEDRKAAVLVLLAGLSKDRRSSERWAESAGGPAERAAGVLRELGVAAAGRPGSRPAGTARRIEDSQVIGDGHLGIWAGLRQVYPEAQEQRCWNHRILNLLDRIGKKDQPAAVELLRTVVYADTLQEAERQKATFRHWCRQRGYDDAAELIDQDWERMVAFYGFPKEHWPHLRTTNPVESPFAALRLRTAAAERFKRVENATAVMCKMLLIAESRSRRLNAPELMQELFDGAIYVNGIRGEEQPRRIAA